MPGRHSSPADRIQQRLDRLQPGLPGDERLARLVLADLGREPLPLALGDVGKIREQQVARTALRQSDATPLLTTSTRSPSPSRSVFDLSDSKRVHRSVDRDHPGLGQLVGDRQRDGAAAGPHVDYGARPGLERHLDQQLGLGPRNQHPSIHLKLDPPEALVGPGCRRRARAGRAAGPSRRTPCEAPTGSLISGSAAIWARSHPVAPARSTSASRRADSQPAAVRAPTAPSSASRAAEVWAVRSSPPSAPRGAGAFPPTRARP